MSEGRYLRQARDGAAHGLHAVHQCRKAEQDRAGVLSLAVGAEEEEHDANEGENRSEGGGLEQLEQQALAGDPRQAQKPGGDCRANVCAHDDINRLAQPHQPRIDEADDHNGGGGGALDDGGDAEAGQKAGEFMGCHPLQQGLQAAARPAFQRLPHNLHPEQEQTEPAEQR